MVSLVAAWATGGCGGTGRGDVRGAMRAACYPPCLANLVARCPLVSACTANTEPNVARSGESQGVAICFGSGERERQATDLLDHYVVYVKSPDGSECYAAVGEDAGGVQTWDLSVGGQLFGRMTWEVASGAVTVSCDDATTQIDLSNPVCAGLPWMNITPCDRGQTCTFGDIPAPGVWDGGAP